MSKNDNETSPQRNGGRRPKTPKTERGRAILAAIESQGLTLYAAAKRGRLTFPALYAAIHGDPAKLSVRTVTALCGRLNLPLALVAPQIASLASVA